MKKLYDILISNFLARYIFLLSFMISVITLFGNINIKEFPNLLFFIKVGLVFIIPLFLNIFYEMFTKHIVTNISDTSDILNILNHRIGTQVSLRTLDDREYDNIHKYSLLYRQDMLKFDTLNYYSFRVLKGINISKNISSHLIYSESSDIPVAFENIRINARNNINGKPLVVECLHSTTEKRLQHIFRINFDKPIHPNQEFDISFSIEISGEMSVYDTTKEIQSVSLVRLKHPLDKLIFNICLDYEPRAVKVYAKRITNGLKEIDGATIKRYIPHTELQQLYDLQWDKSIPYIIETEIQHPSADQYIIEFIK